MRKFIIVDTGGHGRTVLSYLERTGVPKKQIAFVDIFKKKEGFTLGCPVVGDLTSRVNFPFGKVGLIVAYGGDPYTENTEREVASKAIVMLLDCEHEFVIAKDPSAIVVENAEVSTNVSICINAMVCSRSRIQGGNIINNGAILEHDFSIDSFSNISPGALIMGCSHIGERIFVGAGAIIRDGVSIGDDSVIGMGAVVTDDIPPKSLVVGTPARVIRQLP